MPGLSIVCDLTGDRQESVLRSEESLGSLKHYPWYGHSVLLDDAHLFLGWTGYEEYPITVVENGEFYICLEGLIYGISPDNTRTELEKLSTILSAGPDRYRSRTADWMSNVDGDFLIFILNKRSGEIWIINDALGRLPVYYHETSDKIIVSRELRFVSKLIDEIRFDSSAISQYLLLGYPLGRKTLFDGIFRLDPASVIRVDPSRREIRLETMLRYNAEESAGERQEPGECARTIAESLCRSSIERADAWDKTLVALSGGLDSRTVAASLKKGGVPFTGITFLDSSVPACSDVPVARQVAKTLDCDWRMFRTEPAKGKDALKLLRIKSGMNFLGMSFSIPICLELRNIYGRRAVLFTGEGGDKLLPDVRPPVHLADVDSLAHYIIGAFGVLPLDVVSDMMMVDRSEIIGGLTERLESYDERDMKMKCMHFLVFERNFKWLFEGEDRNRCHFWVASPFYSPDAFSKTLHCPVEYKERYRLYRDVLRNLSPEATSIDYAKWMVPIDSRGITFYCYLRKVYLSLPSGVRKRLRRLYGGSAVDYRSDSNIMRCMRGQLERCSAISDYLSTEQVRKNLHRCSKMGIDNLFTITSVIEDFSGQGSTIEEYLDSELIG
jgi:asparagine synthase (glutamine-hydrolysing)